MHYSNIYRMKKLMWMKLADIINEVWLHLKALQVKNKWKYLEHRYKTKVKNNSRILQSGMRL